MAVSTVSTNDILIKVRADTQQAVASLASVQESLAVLGTEAAGASAALDSIGTGVHTVNVNSSEIAAAEIQAAELEGELQVLSEPINIPVNLNTGGAEGGLAKTSRSFGLLKTTVAGVIGYKVGQWLLDGAKNAATFESDMTSLNEVLGKTTQIEVQDWIEGSADDFKLSTIQAADLARSLTIVADQFQSAGGDAGDFLITMEKVTGEVASFNNADPGQVAAAFNAAFRGQFETLQQFGIFLDEGTIKAEAMSEGILQAGQEMTPAIRTTATYNAILKQVGPQMDSVRDHAKTTKGSFDELKTTFSDLGTTVGSVLGPKLKEISDDLDFVGGKIQFVIDKYHDLQELSSKGDITPDKNTFRDVEQFFGTLATGSIVDITKKWLEMRDAAFGGLGEDTDKAKNTFSDVVNFMLTETTKSLPEIGKYWFEMGKNAFGAGEDVKDAGGKVKQGGDAIHHTDTFLTAFIGHLQDEIDAQAAAADATEDHVLSMKHLNDRVQNTADAFDELIGKFTATNSAMIDARTALFDYGGAVDDLAESLIKHGSDFSPDKEAGRENWAALVGFADAASTRVTNTLKNKGAEAANAVFNNSRNTMHQMLVDAGVDSAKAWQLVNQVFKKPINMKIGLDMAQIKKDNAELVKLRKKRRKILEDFQTRTASPISADAAERAGAQKDALLLPLNLQIHTDLENKAETQEDLDSLTKDDRGKNRKAQINAHVDPASIDQANADLDGIIKLHRTAEIQVHIIPPDIPLLGGIPLGPGGDGGTGGGGGGTGGGGGRGAPLPGSNGDDRRPPTPTSSRRENVNVSVYMDGKVVAQNVPGRVSRGSRAA